MSDSNAPTGEELERNQTELTHELEDNPAAEEIAAATEGEVAGQPGQ